MRAIRADRAFGKRVVKTGARRKEGVEVSPCGAGRARNRTSQRRIVSLRAHSAFRLRVVRGRVARCVRQKLADNTSRASRRARRAPRARCACRTVRAKVVGCGAQSGVGEVHSSGARCAGLGQLSRRAAIRAIRTDSAVGNLVVVSRCRRRVHEVPPRGARRARRRRCNRRGVSARRARGARRRSSHAERPDGAARARRRGGTAVRPCNTRGTIRRCIVGRGAHVGV